MHICFSFVWFSSSVLSQQIGWKNVSKMAYFVLGGTDVLFYCFQFLLNQCLFLQFLHGGLDPPKEIV